MNIKSIINIKSMNFMSFIIMLVVLSSVSCVYAVEYGDKNTIDSTVTITNTFTIARSGNSFRLDFINATLMSYPRSDARQMTTNIVTSPVISHQTSNNLNFIYPDPLEGKYDLSLTAHVSTINMMDEITVPVTFPLNNLDVSLYDYIKPTEIIDVNSDIKNLASELIGDKTDLYEIEYTFAEYVRKNINYDLGTLTSNADQKSSWVLKNRRGVCDEITNLFISLNRAAGIPTRFVSGVSYTNLGSLFGKSWVSHAWAEVYYPGVGWVPYDVTYGQYGFIDAGHIKLADSSDSSNMNVDYRYLGNDAKLVPGSFDIDVKVLDYGESTRARYTFDVSTYHDKIGFGSYDLVVVDVTSLAGFYQVADLYLAETSETTIIEKTKETLLNRSVYRQEVLLKPYQSKTIYWIIKLNDDLDSNYIYNFPITVYNNYNESKKTLITSEDNYPVTAYDYFDKFVSSKLEESEKAYSKYIYLECSSNKDNIYFEDSSEISCILDNRGEKSFDKVNICIEDNCSISSLAVQKIPLNYRLKFDSVGLKNIQVKAYNDDFNKASYVTINVLDEPVISISDVVYPSVVDYVDSFDIVFTLNKNSSSIPKNISLRVKSETTHVEWSFEELDTDRLFSVKSSGDALRPNNNTYTIIVTYQDDKGITYTAEKLFSITSKATFFQNMFLYANLFFGTIENMFTK